MGSLPSLYGSTVGNTGQLRERRQYARGLTAVVSPIDRVDALPRRRNELVQSAPSLLGARPLLAIILASRDVGERHNTIVEHPANLPRRSAVDLTRSNLRMKVGGEGRDVRGSEGEVVGDMIRW